MAPIRKAAVLGAGVMGTGIAAHLANASIPTLLLDIVPKELTDEEKAAGLTLDAPQVRNRFATAALAAAKKTNPAPFAHKDFVQRITVGNFEDDLDQLADVDWVVEAVVERLDIKTSLFHKVEEKVGPHTLVTSNTSGLSIEAMAAGLPEQLKHRFFGTHFFNPPRYMHLLELIPAASTDRELIEEFARFAERRLGKGVVWAKDTPNFVGNRIGVFGMLSTLHAMARHGLDVATVDALTGKAMGRPKSATFRTADMVGLDILGHVAKTQLDGATEETEKSICELPRWINDMLASGNLGMKTGGGFYKRVKEDGKSVILAIDPATGDYAPKPKVRLPVLDEIKEEPSPGKRLGAVLKSKGPAADFAWEVTAQGLAFAARRVGEICDDVVGVDQALKWGFGWEIGPFEMWDELGVAKTVERMQADGHELPEAVLALAQSDTPSFYLLEGADKKVWDFASRTHVDLPARNGVTVLADLKRTEKTLFSNAEASLVDLGDGVACLEFHSKANALGGGIIKAIMKATGPEASSSYDALVIGNQAENFSVGANLMLILFEALEGNIPELDMMVRAFQRGMMAIKYSPVPVVAAPFGRVLGGGCEVCLHSHRIQASLETYMGLVEVGVGLIPGGGGTKEMLLRTMKASPGPEANPLNFVRQAFEAIGMAKVSFSAHEARSLGFLGPEDMISMNPEQLINDAKQSALGLLETGWQPMQGPETVKVMGTDGMGNIKMMLHNMLHSGYVSEHDVTVSTKLGRVLCGGEIDPGTVVDENWLLDLERRSFLELLSERKTLERMRHTLQTGKPLRN